MCLYHFCFIKSGKGTYLCGLAVSFDSNVPWDFVDMFWLHFQVLNCTGKLTTKVQLFYHLSFDFLRLIMHGMRVHIYDAYFGAL